MRQRMPQLALLGSLMLQTGSACVPKASVPAVVAVSGQGCYIVGAALHEN